MNRNRIKNKINAKIRSWLSTITDKDLKKQLEENIIVTGGAFVSLFSDEEPNDYDVYIKDYDVLVKVAVYYANKWNGLGKRNSVTVETGGEVDTEKGTNDKYVKLFVRSAGIAEESETELASLFGFDEESEEAEENKEYRPVFFSQNAITLAGGIQIVTRFFGDPDEIHKSFDFVHCTNYYEYSNQNLVLRPEAVESYLFKELRYVGSMYPLASILRTRKFINRGYKVSAGEMLKMMFQVSQLDLSDPAVLAEQLVGVDLTYMNEILYIISNHDGKIDATYFCTVVDKVFKNDTEDARNDEVE